MPPKISIIIPVYNVEQYLRQCLDSVVNQTLRDIQIICVDHSSSDGSLAILEEFAANDSRIAIVHCKNTRGGPGQARNAGLPYIQGKYMYFVDSDDWLEPTLCEKAYDRLESTGADVVFFFFHEIAETTEDKKRVSDPLFFSQWKTTSLQAGDFLDWFCAPWSRVIRTSFFQSLDVRFPEAHLPEDFYLHWVILVNDPQVELILEKLYNYRLREGSQMGQLGEYVAKDCQACSLIKEYLRRIGKYEQYRTSLLVRKFSAFIVLYPAIRKSIQPDALRWFRETLDDEEMEFLRKSKEIPPEMRDAILYLLDDPFTCWKMRWKAFRAVLRKRIIKPIETVVKLLRKDKRKSRKFAN